MIMKHLLWILFALIFSCASSGGPVQRVREDRPKKMRNDLEFLQESKDFFSEMEKAVQLSIQSVDLRDGKLVVLLDESAELIISLETEAIRINWGSDDVYSYALETSEDPPNTPLLMLQDGSYGTDFGSLIQVVEDELLLLGEEPIRIFGFAQRGTKKIISYGFEDERSFYGFGEKSGRLEKTGQMLRMWNTDSYLYNAETDPIYLSMPIFHAVGKSNVATFFLDNPGQSYFDLSTSKLGSLGTYIGDLDLRILVNDTVQTSLEEMAEEYTGMYPMPPRWSLGYQQCRFSYYPQARVENLAATFREKNLPCDVIYLDIDFMDNYKSFTYSPSNFPDPKALIQSLHDQGFKVVTIIDPGIRFEKGWSVFDSGIEADIFMKEPDGTYSRGTVWPGMCLFPDFTHPDTDQWWKEQYPTILDLGFDGIWNDMNEPSVFNTEHRTLYLDSLHHDYGSNRSHLELHNIYGSSMARSSYQAIDELTGDKRVFLLSRSGYSGIQRYAAVWTGDNTSNWEHLRMNIPMVLGMSLSGLPFTGADIGGYSESPDGELFARWMQLGAFLPLYRGHTEKGTSDQEPWSFGIEVENLSREALELRYQFLPYIYSLFWEHARTGAPLVLPLWTLDQDDASIRSNEDSFLLGNDILIAPILFPEAVSREVVFPGDESWIHFYSGDSYLGGTSAEVSAPLEEIPFFLRAGSVIPMGKSMNYVGETDPEETIVIVPGGSGELIYWYAEDDGVTEVSSKEFEGIPELSIRHEEGRIIIERPVAGKAHPKRILIWGQTEALSQSNAESYTSMGSQGLYFPQGFPESLIINY
jgi:alpha-glucosidase